MTKGTPSQGKGAKSKSHIACRRCGKRAFHIKRKICASCGYGRSSKLRNYGWNKRKHPGK